MHNPYSQPGIRIPFRLIPTVAGGTETGTDDSVDSRDEQPDSRKRLLLVEDEFLLSAVLSADLQTAGYDVLGPFATVTEAMHAVQAESFDGAILDINLRGELVYPLAEELARHGIPFLFLSGYEASNMPVPFRGHARLSKPADPAVLTHAVRTMLRAAS
ncbi:MAG TPA: response regulator [Rhizomicrobium sp.]|nr:response regulator [Rhizomicrobium sp.]